jgi:malonate-semialdehyde dehydrogenase (acetylating)/methylmalonate-semialdehyde dehydrogenase
VFNVVNGDKEAVDTLLEDPRVKAIGFVGSTPIAQYIYETAARNGKRAQCFGGAKNHMVILPDADLDMAADALIGAGYGSAGERCMAISVAVPVGEETADALVGKLRERIAGLRVGASLDKDVDFGPVVAASAKERIEGYIAAGAEEGAELVVDGRGHAVEGYDGGFWVGPTLFDRVTKDMSIYRDEIFGPVLSVVRAADYDEALRLCSEHEFGNGVAIFTRDGDAARDFASRVEVGMVGVNVPIPVPIAYYTFGGWKASGFGDLNQHGPDAFRFFTKTKTVTSRWPSGVRQGASFVMPAGS